MMLKIIFTLLIDQVAKQGEPIIIQGERGNAMMNPKAVPRFVDGT